MTTVADVFRHLGGVPIHGNPSWAFYGNDFLTAQDYDVTNSFNQVKDAGAAVAIAADSVGGAVTITSTAVTDNDGGYFGLNQENFRLTSTNELWFLARVQGSSVADQDLWVGLSEAVATNPENVVADTTHRVGFELIDGSAIVQCKTSDGTTATAVSSGFTAVDNTYFDVKLWWRKTELRFYINNALVLKTATTLPAASASLTPGFFSLSGSTTGTRTATIDYMFVAMSR